MQFAMISYYSFSKNSTRNYNNYNVITSLFYRETITVYLQIVKNNCINKIIHKTINNVKINIVRKSCYYSPKKVLRNLT